MKPHLDITLALPLALALVLTGAALAQDAPAAPAPAAAPPPAQAQPTPLPSAPPAAAPAPVVTPAPAAPHTTSPPQPPQLITPKDPASVRTLTSIIHSEKSVIKERDDYIREHQHHIDDLTAQIVAYDKIAQREIDQVKHANTWGEDILYDGQAEKFMKVSPEMVAEHKAALEKQAAAQAAQAGEKK